MDSPVNLDDVTVAGRRITPKRKENPHADDWVSLSAEWFSAPGSAKDNHGNTLTPIKGKPDMYQLQCVSTSAVKEINGSEAQAALGDVKRKGKLTTNQFFRLFGSSYAFKEINPIEALCAAPSIAKPKGEAARSIPNQ